LKELIGSRVPSQVAKEIGINQRTLSRYLLAQSEYLGLEILIKIADYFHESFDVIVGRKTIN